jgi:2-dehydro-3-deoxyphosphogluconate aldolase/(4S)-4-hydroxy-2-oxoglutarate aldolase
MKNLQTIQTILDEKIIAVVRTQSTEEAEKVAEAAYEGGIRIIELTLTTPNALTIIKDLKKKYGAEMTVGAGTVLDEVAARFAVENGADFVVSPHLDAAIVHMCHLYQVPIIPGATNTKEVVEALKLGCGIIKLFPANFVGPKAIGSFKGPFPQASFIPTGGVNAETITDWLNAGAVAVGTGSELTKEAMKTGDFTKVTNYAQKLVKAAKELGGTAK